MLATGTSKIAIPSALVPPFPSTPEEFREPKPSPAVVPVLIVFSQFAAEISVVAAPLINLPEPPT